MLIKVFFKETKKIVTVRRNEFKRHEDNILPGIEVILDGLSRQFGIENANIEAEAMLLKAFVANQDYLCFGPRKRNTTQILNTHSKKLTNIRGVVKPLIGNTILCQERNLDLCQPNSRN